MHPFAALAPLLGLAGVGGSLPHQSKLIPDGLTVAPGYGGAIASDGEHVAVCDLSDFAEGAVYVFSSDGAFEAKIEEPDADPFGFDVALEGGVLAVSGGVDVRLYREGHDGWSPWVTIPGAAISVALDRGTLVVGRVYTPTVEVWDVRVGGVLLEAEIHSPPGQGAFGYAVALERGTLVVGSRGANAPGQSGSKGAAYVYRRAAYGVWLLEGVLAPPVDVVPGSYFGQDVGVHDGWAVVGDPEADSSSQGAAFVYRRVEQGSSVTWELAQRLLPRIEGSSDPSGFGSAVALGPTGIFVGAPAADTHGLSDVGLVFRYELGGGPHAPWGLRDRFSAFDPLHSGFFGSALAPVPGGVAVGSPIYFVGYTTASAYVVELD